MPIMLYVSLAFVAFVAVSVCLFVEGVYPDEVWWFVRHIPNLLVDAVQRIAWKKVE